MFDDLESLEQLLLQGNGLRNLDAGLFENLAKLEELNLSQNDIRTLPESIFSGLSQLDDLHLDHNDMGFGTVHSGLFQGLTYLTYLTYLTLHYNQLTWLPDGIFSGLTSLELLKHNGSASIDRERLGLRAEARVEE